MAKKVLVIGGGIVGLSCAYYLQKEGHEVTVIDKGHFNRGASYVNAGYITPSHIIPLPSPGIITQGLKWMLNPASPFYMKPRLDMDFIMWALKFRSFCTKNHVEHAMRPIMSINLLSRELYEDLKASGDFDFHYERNGLLMAFKTNEAGDKEWKVGQKAQKLGLEVELLSKEDLKSVQPKAEMDAKGAVFFKSDGHTTPTELMPQLLNYLRKKGVIIKSGETVTNLQLKGNQIIGGQTATTLYSADDVVLASGVWSQALAKQLGLKIWLQAGKGYSINVERSLGISLPTILCEAKVAVTPMQGFTRFAGTMEIGGIDHRINPTRVAAIAKAASSYYRNLSISDSEKRDASCGLRPVSPDGLPYIGRPTHIKNLIIATGHAMMGWSLGPATGKLVSELISGKELSMNIEAFDPNRFGP
jgi:D-amino-acid dehydrogenase